MNYERIKKIAGIKWYKLWNVEVWQSLEVHEKIVEWKNERIWKFRWLVIKVHKKKMHDWNFTIRWKASWITIEKVYPLICQSISQILLQDKYKIRRAKLYYIRVKIWKDARLKSILTSDQRWSKITTKAFAVADTVSVSDTTPVSDATEVADTTSKKKWKETTKE